MNCPAGHEMKLVKSKKHRNFDGTRVKSWVCTHYPTCDYRVHADRDGKPQGIPADKETRRLRKEIHDLCYQIWNYKDKGERSRMYGWLKRNSQAGHIGQMDKEELYHVRDLLMRGRVLGVIN